jgi:hypothetical protein
MCTHWLRPLLLLILFAGWTGSVAPQNALAQDDDKEKGANLPVKRVVMFSSGVGFFERTGSVDGDAELNLKFNVRDINDLLKSMVLQDLGGGRISTVSYESKKPIEKTLQTFAIDLTSNPTLADLLDQVRGERIEVDAPTKITGTIVGIEHREIPAGKDETIKTAFLTLLTDEGLVSISLDRVGRLKLLNPKLDAELRQALAVLAGNKSVDKKSVTLSFLGQGKRNVQVGYIQESPIWKTSYRLVLDDEAAPLLQGWAIVENTTEEDWDGVQLSLVSGRPISFLMDLYQPLFVDRPVVQQELYSSLKPRTYDQDLAQSEVEFRKAAEREQQNGRQDQLALRRNALGLDGVEKSRAMAAAPPPAPAAKSEGFLAAADAERDAFRPGQSVESVAQAADVGEMFQYTIATPVKLGRQQSAMLPIVNDSVEGEKVSIYNPAVHAKHPLNGLRLKNTTDLHLMQGPITVFDDGAYAGDARIQDLPPKSERLISYAMDLDTEVAPRSEGKPTQLVGVKLVKGTLYTTRRFNRENSYVVKNSGQKAKKVLVEYPVDNAWTLSEPAEPAEKTRDLYRFALEAKPGEPANLKIVESRTAEEQVLVTNLDSNTIVFYLNAKEVSQPIKDALQEVVKRKQALGAVTQQLAELNRQINVIFQEQGRVRQNMTEVPKDSELFRRYLTKFGEQEDQVEQLRAQVEKVIAEQAAAQKALDNYLIKLDLT